MTVSVVVPHYGPLAFTEACVAALAWHTADYELVIVDNGTGDPLDANVVVRNPDNVGFGRGSNQGAAASHGDMLVFLNNDCEVRSGWLEPLVAHLERGVGIVGPLLLYPDGRVQQAGIALHRDAAGMLVAENRRGHYAQGLVEAVTGACLAIHRDLFWQLGGFHQGYYNGYEDVDLCLSARQAGWRVVFEPASTVTHHESQSGTARWVAVRDNVELLQERWADYRPMVVVTNG